MKRLIAAAGLALMACAQPALSATPAAGTALETKTVPVEKAFPFLKDYYALKAHDRFRLDFYLNGPALPPSFRMVMKRKAGDVPIVVAGDRRFGPLPDSQDFAAHVPLEVTAPKGLKIALNVKISSTATPARTLDAKGLSAGIDQVRQGVKTMAGLMAMLVPDFGSVCFDGAKSGEVALADGKMAALKVSKTAGDVAIGSPCFTPSDYPTATQVTLDKVPTGMFIVPKQP